MGIVEACDVVRKSGVPNFRGAQILVQTKFNVKYLERQLKHYPDKNILLFVKFGFPVNHDRSEVSQSRTNHAGALNEFKAEILKHIEGEVEKGIVFGPVWIIPFSEPMAILPLNSVPKKDSSKGRVILDLSFPRGKSVMMGSVQKHI